MLSNLKRDIPRLLSLAGPLLVGQLAVIAFGVMDTAMVARYSTDDLAALAMAGSIFISIYVGLTGVISALAPIAGQLFGAKRFSEIGEEVRQGWWLSLGLSIFGMLILMNPGVFLSIANTSPEVEAKAILYLQIVAWGLPASLAMRVLVAFHNAISKPAVVTWLQIGGLFLKIPLNAWLIYGGLGVDAMGGPGCALATVIINWLWFLTMLMIVYRGKFYQIFGVYEKFSKPNLHRIATLLKLGLPIGLSYLIEVTSFAFMALFIAKLGTIPLAGHQIVANLGTVLYMLPLSLSIATSTLVAQSLGADKPTLAKEIGWSSLVFTTTLSVLVGLLVWIFRYPLLDLYAPSADVRSMATPLFLFIAFYQIFDALQVTSAFILRGYRVAFWPMWIYAISLWGVGLGGGYILGFNLTGNVPEILQGAQGFWFANSLSLAIAATFLITLFKRTAKRFEREHPPVEV
jgi:MATE family multidrug resistance protein